MFKYLFNTRYFTLFDLLIFASLCVLFYKDTIGFIMFVVLNFVADSVSAALQTWTEDDNRK